MSYMRVLRAAEEPVAEIEPALYEKNHPGTAHVRGTGGFRFVRTWPLRFKRSLAPDTVSMPWRPTKTKTYDTPLDAPPDGERACTAREFFRVGFLDLGNKR